MSDDYTNDFDDGLNFTYVSKKSRKKAAPEEEPAQPTRKKRKTAHEVERDAKAAAAMAKLAREQGMLPNAAAQSWAGDEGVPVEGQDYYSAGRAEQGPVDTETRARINRSRNNNLTFNALMEVDPTTKRTMQMSFAPGTAATGGIPHYRSTNRLATAPNRHGNYPRDNNGILGRGYGGYGRGRGRGGGEGGRGGYSPYRGGGYTDHHQPQKRDRE